jgi:hypothetical protein
MALVSALLLALPCSAQVIFINVDDIPFHASTNTGIAPHIPSLHLHTAIVRFLPAKISKPIPEFTGDATMAAVVSALAKQGQVNLLYSGDRVAPGGIDSVAIFDSVERRPAFSTKAKLNQTLTNRAFGLRLTLKARPLVNGSVELKWNGDFTWSSDLLNAWSGEKYLVFGMRVAQFARPGLFYYEDADQGEDEPAGLNLRSLFGRKKEALPKSVVPDISFLSADDRKIPLIGQRSVKPGELIVVSTVSNLDPEQPEVVFLLLRFEHVE